MKTQDCFIVCKEPAGGWLDAVTASTLKHPMLKYLDGRLMTHQCAETRTVILQFQAVESFVLYCETFAGLLHCPVGAPHEQEVRRLVISRSL